MTHDHADRPDASRRQVLQLLGLVGTAVSTRIDPAAVFAKAKRKPKGVVVYRLSVRGTSRCKACARHHRRFAYLTHALANAHRAHPGCNCPIDTQLVRPHTAKLLFSARQQRQLAISSGSRRRGELRKGKGKGAHRTPNRGNDRDKNRPNGGLTSAPLPKLSSRRALTGTR